VMPREDMSVLRSDPTEQVEAYAREVLGRSAQILADQPNTTQLDAVYIARTVGHFGAYRCAAEAFVRSELPAYYKGLFNAGFSASHRHRNGHKLHRATIERVNPTVSAVETERGGPAQRMRLDNAHRFAPYYVRLGKMAVRKVRREPSPPKAEGVAERAYRRGVQALRAEGLLDPATMRTGEIYDHGALKALLDRANGPDFANWSMVGRVVTLELALRAVDGAKLPAL
jgi:hypothetical protein